MGWGGWVEPHARRNGRVPQFPLRPSQDGLTPALEMPRVWLRGFTPGRMPREMHGEGRVWGKVLPRTGVTASGGPCSS